MCMSYIASGKYHHASEIGDELQPCGKEIAF